MELILRAGTIRVIWKGLPPLRLPTKHDKRTRLENVRRAELQRIKRCLKLFYQLTRSSELTAPLVVLGYCTNKLKSGCHFNSIRTRQQIRRLDQLSWQTLTREFKTQIST
ncbi:LOW QUALITY PROTEIN: hypothetical protein PHMEG_00014343 [Phytophthora megakarya]|uniref:Uncharacterized protein n=1 Tax=Phytophthora megakarya TaxID=4795 RepID=A0A225W5K9_9STRA|nr:LOW QUALITY PROTEIN: hypothetical protein PHMEG_00014343 [Phytophthora megakarya]